MSEVQKELERLRLLEKEREVKEGLPHLYGWPWYQWAWEFFTSTNKTNLLCAANQISKSSTQIRKAIDWATDQEKWPFLWKIRPRQFWYLYPTKDVATIEYHTKWKPEFLPRGKFQEEGPWAWEPEFSNKKLHAIHFTNAETSIYIKTYSTDVMHLQSGTCAAIFTDEELPDHLYDELRMRMAATEGYFHMVFTATMGQEFWFDAMERMGQPGERFPDAFKKCVSMYDCLVYRDGTASPWTVDRIKTVEGQCRNRSEIKRRIRGRFVPTDGLKYSFDRDRDYEKPEKIDIPKGWYVYAAVDWGSGKSAGRAHPSAYVFLGVNKQFTLGRIFRARRFDGIETTQGQLYDFYKDAEVDLREHGYQIMGKVYDSAAVDFGMIAESRGDFFEKADKGHDSGTGVVNTLFDNGALVVDNIDDSELEKVAQELSTVKEDAKGAKKRHAKDDLADCVRYVCKKVPWDWEKIAPHRKMRGIKKKEKTELDVRRDIAQTAFFEQRSEEIIQDEEFDFWNEQLNPY